MSGKGVSIIYLLVAWLEWKFLNFSEFFENQLLPPYARVSSVLAAFFLGYSSLYWSKKPSKIIQTLSQESLGIYLIHAYILQIFITLQALPFFLTAKFNPVIIIILTITGSILLSKLLKKYAIGRMMLNVKDK